jgi:hypothetical protein
VNRAYLFLFAGFAFAGAAACYINPVQDDFDRFVYEALIRSDRQSTDEIYPIVKHEALRAESSSVMDSAGHLAELEPLYAVRPLYLQTARIVEQLTKSPQHSLHLISAASLFLCALLLATATRQYVYSALVMLVPGVLTTARMGTPDIFSALVILASIVALTKNRLFVAVLLLLLSVWVRTDNVLFVLTMLAWEIGKKTIPVAYGFVLGALAGGSVVFINHFAGNYGWKVLVQYSFIGGRYPAEITPHITPLVYGRIVLSNAQFLLPQLAPWLLLALVSWRLKSSDRGWLVPVIAASALHYVLFPSPEARYFVWAFLLIALAFLRAIGSLQHQAAQISIQPSIYELQEKVA